MTLTQNFGGVELYKPGQENYVTIDIAGSGQLYLTAEQALAKTIILTGALTGARDLIFPISPLDAGVQYWIDGGAVGGFPANALKVYGYTSLPGAATPVIDAGVAISSAKKRMMEWDGAAFVEWYLEP